MKSEAHPDELLPWYVNGSLEAREREAVEAHLASCDRCRSEIAFLQAMRAGVKGETVQAPTELGLKRLLRDIKTERAPSHIKWWRRIAVAAMVVIVVQAALIAQFWFPPSDSIRPLGETQGEEIVLQLRFVPDATEARMRAALQEVNGVFIDGPSASGVYRVRLADKLQEDQVVRVIDRLRANRIIEHIARE